MKRIKKMVREKNLINVKIIDQLPRNDYLELLSEL